MLALKRTIRELGIRKQAMALREWERPCEELPSGAGHADILFAGLQRFQLLPCLLFSDFEAS